MVKKDMYNELHKSFKWNIPKHYNFGFDVIDKWAEDRTKLALISIDRSGKRDRYHTFRDLSVESNRYANALRKMGIKKGNGNIAFVFVNDVKAGDSELSDHLVDELLEGFSLVRDDVVLEGDMDTLRKFGINENEIKTVTKAKYGHLILEKVAVVDIIK